MDKQEFRVLIKHCFLMGKNTVEEKQWLDKRYGDSAPEKTTIIDWKTSVLERLDRGSREGPMGSRLQNSH